LTLKLIVLDAIKSQSILQKMKGLK